MKITSLLFVFTAILFFSGKSYAQPVITSGVMGGIGATPSFNSVDATDFDPGATGADVIWDFSDITVGGVAPSAEYVEPSSTPYAADFPGTNITATDGSSYEYFKLTDEEYTLYGAYKGGILTYYDDPEELLIFPLTFSDTNTGTLHSDFFSGVDFERAGDVTMTADGYGTLILPTGSFPNILRVKIEEVYSDINVDYAIEINYVFDSYLWFAEGLTGALFEYFHDDIDLSGVPSTIEMAYMNTSMPTVSINTQVKTTAEIFPNPASENVTIRLDENKKIDAISMFDITGRQSAEYMCDGASGEYSMNISGLPSGIYTVQIKSGADIYTKNISIN